VVRSRLEVYRRQTAQLVDYYGKWAAAGQASAPRYRKVSGLGPIDEVRERVLGALH